MTMKLYAVAAVTAAMFAGATAAEASVTIDWSFTGDQIGSPMVAGRMIVDSIGDDPRVIGVFIDKAQGVPFTSRSNYAESSLDQITFLPDGSIGFVNFAGRGPNSSSLTLRSFGVSSYVSADGTISGRFASFAFEAAPAAVPEPATWAMLVGGFGLVGGAMRRKGFRISFA